MRTTPRSETEAVAVARNVLLRAGWYDAEFREAVEKTSSRNNAMIEVDVAVSDPDGNERLFRDWLVDTPRGAAKLLHACDAAGVIERYEAGEIVASDFPGKRCRVRVGVEKGRGYPDRNVIEDYAAAHAPVSLRVAK
jgi:hypothetical protein